MISLNFINDKDSVKKGNQKKKILFKILAKEKTAKKRIPLNISLVIDNSGSMNDYIQRKDVSLNGGEDLNNFLKNINAQNEYRSYGGGNTKLNQVKEAAKQCIDLLHDCDYVSIVTFNDNAQLIQLAIQVNSENKEEIKKKINSIYAGGSTNLHGGWVMGGIEVAKNLSNEKINRVILLTDGETNRGVVDANEIAEHTKGLFQRGISTSTFGVGDHYNENLLEKMADVSGGNAYYIEDENKIVEMLLKEFASLGSIIGNSAKIKFVSENKVTVESLNEIEKIQDSFVVGNIVANKELKLLFEFEFTNNKNKGQRFVLGNIELTYLDSKGKKQTETITLEYKTLADDEFEAIEITQEVLIQETILDLAKKQKKAKEEILRGNRNEGYRILDQSMIQAQAFSFDARVASELGEMQNLKNIRDSYSDLKMSKVLSSMSYNTRRNQKD